MLVGSSGHQILFIQVASGRQLLTCCQPVLSARQALPPSALVQPWSQPPPIRGSRLAHYGLSGGIRFCIDRPGFSSRAHCSCDAATGKSIWEMTEMHWDFETWESWTKALKCAGATHPSLGPRGPRPSNRPSNGGRVPHGPIGIALESWKLGRIQSIQSIIPSESIKFHQLMTLNVAFSRLPPWLSRTVPLSGSISFGSTSSRPRQRGSSPKPPNLGLTPSPCRKKRKHLLNGPINKW